MLCCLLLEHSGDSGRNCGRLNRSSAAVHAYRHGDDCLPAEAVSGNKCSLCPKVVQQTSVINLDVVVKEVVLLQLLVLFPCCCFWHNGCCYACCCGWEFVLQLDGLVPCLFVWMVCGDVGDSRYHDISCRCVSFYLVPCRL